MFWQLHLPVPAAGCSTPCAAVPRLLCISTPAGHLPPARCAQARQNLLDSLCCATASFSPPHVHLQEVAICFGGRLMRGNRAQKVNSSAYQVGRAGREASICDTASHWVTVFTCT